MPEISKNIAPMDGTQDGQFRALADSRERARRLELLHQASLALNSVHDPEALLDRILEIAEGALGFRSVAILEAVSRGKELVVRKVRRREGVMGLRIAAGQGIVGSVFTRGKAERVADVSADPRYITGGLQGGRSEMAAPLRLDGEIIGVLDAEAENPGAFTAEDLELLDIFAAQVATALRNASQMTRIERQAKVLHMISRVGRALNTVRNIKMLLREILNAAREAMGLDRVALLLADRQHQELVVRSSVGYGEIQDRRIPYGKGVTGEVAASGEGMLVRDVRQESRYLSGVEGGLTEMAVPLHVFGTLMGVLDTESPDPDAFDETDLELFQAFADQAAVAIHNAQLFLELEEANERLSASVEEMNHLNRELEDYSTQIEEANRCLESQVQQLQTLYEASQTISSSLDLRSTLDTILRMTGRIVNSSAGAIKLIDAETQELRVKAQAGFLHEESAEWDKMNLPLRIGEKTIGVFELIRDASKVLGPSEQKMLETLASHAAIAIENARLFEDTQKTYYDTLKSLARALEARDDYTRGHSERVAELSITTAQALGAGEEECTIIYNAALLHDIGKIGVRDAVLLKTLPLTSEEYEVVQKHPTFGTTILGPLKFLGKVAEYVKYHHERWDGSGYPFGLKGEEIPFASRIIGVADTYDAMTSSRPYRDARSHEAATTEVQAQAGRQFDPAVVEAFLRVMAVGRH